MAGSYELSGETMKNFAHKQGKIFLRSAVAVAIASAFAPGSALAQEAAPPPASDAQQPETIDIAAMNRKNTRSA